MGRRGAFPDSESLISFNHDILASVIGSLDEAREAAVYHYHKSFRGFSAMLTPEQAAQIANHTAVVSVFKSQVLELHTTRTWSFMGARPGSPFTGLADKGDYDVIVGHFDSGVWPEHSSFSSEGLGPVPERFRGVCETGDSFTTDHCNRKLIGARYYYRGFERDMGSLSEGFHFLSPRDDFKHGSHTASIAVGAVVTDLSYSFFGENTSTIRGGAPYARLAIYKTCWFNQCSCADIAKAFDDAIDDNVDIISMSLGQPGTDADFINDCFSLGALHAFQNGILVSASAGNDAEPYTVGNAAPWILTVAASSVDREFDSRVELGNGDSLKGYAYHDDDQSYSANIVTALSAAIGNVRPERARYACHDGPNDFVITSNLPSIVNHQMFICSACKWNSLDYSLIRGKVVVCTMENWNDNKEDKSQVIWDAGGRGMIVIDPHQYTETTLDFAVPTSVINQAEGEKLYAYLQNSWNPTALIHDTRVSFEGIRAPKMAYFSSKGPSSAPDIIKIVYEVSLIVGAVVYDATNQPIQADGRDATPFDFGSGHLMPNYALRPGLVYDFSTNDVISYLCSAGVNNWQLQSLLREDAYCPYQAVPTYNLNYPSIAVSNMNGPTTVIRTVTYRGEGQDPKTFQLSVEHPEGIHLEVQPNFLDFSDGRKTMTYRVDISVRNTEVLGRYVFGSITWYNNVQKVRSPGFNSKRDEFYEVLVSVMLDLEEPDKQYIVYMGKKGAFPNSESLISANHDMLASVMGSLDEARQATVHHYHKSFRGFSAMFTPEQADQIANHSEVVSVFKSQVLDLHTTRTWTFMGARPKSYYSSLANYKDYDVIVGHFDSGTAPCTYGFVV
ncbi:LOW QUALITY PROTEIN: hypothetical protein RJ639_004134 [Escallonia herrerae]|uniref:Uncharacterized protein n=1 Tax=Escallonia herrerae TaxID=1293975 RepID=A0AA88W298_9ASTE|nr:LOW QUALITY PROTEIN: hypothetical protein RJ639_004134 [Escallonia herrerae]